jgi:hypothetical protein
MEAWILKLRVVFQNCEFIFGLLAINCELSKWGVSSPAMDFATLWGICVLQTHLVYLVLPDKKQIPRLKGFDKI